LPTPSCLMCSASSSSQVRSTSSPDCSGKPRAQTHRSHSKTARACSWPGNGAGSSCPPT
jgi:hypothetical protein